MSGTRLSWVARAVLVAVVSIGVAAGWAVFPPAAASAANHGKRGYDADAPCRACQPIEDRSGSSCARCIDESCASTAGDGCDCDCKRCRDDCFLAERRRSRCNMPPHYPYFPGMHGYYYFRPYHESHLTNQQALAVQWGGDARNPYANEIFRSVYARYRAEREKPAQPREEWSLEGLQ